MGCNGATFNADDVVNRFQRAKSVSGTAPIGGFLSNVGSIKGFGDAVVKVDDYTVQIKQGEPNALFLSVLTICGRLMFDKETTEANATADDPWSYEYVNETNAPGFGA